MTQGLPPFPATLRRIVTVTALSALFPACTSPLTPTALGPLAEGSTPVSVSASNPVLTPGRVTVSFPLINGVFSITLRTADGSIGTISGTYTGQAVAAIPGNTTASLELHIVQATGAGSLITGLEADGVGAFVDEGNFTLSLKIASSASKILDGSKVILRGTAQLSCSASHRTVVTQHATDSTPRFAELTIDLQHEVGTSQCSAL